MRHVNADLRLREYGYQVGLISEEQYQKFMKKKADIVQCIEEMKNYKVSPKANINEALQSINSSTLKDGTTLFELIKRPEVNAKFVLANFNLNYDLEIVSQAEIQIKYEGYIKKAFKEADKLISQEERYIPKDIDYDKISNLALEAKEKLKAIRPLTIGQASRISGVNPADIAVLTVYIKGGIH